MKRTLLDRVIYAEATMSAARRRFAEAAARAYIDPEGVRIPSRRFARAQRAHLIAIRMLNTSKPAIRPRGAAKGGGK